MEKKPLIGVSLCAVVLLVLASLSTVMGHQSVKSTMNDSPLFTSRTQRAIRQPLSVLSPQYLGKTRKIPFSIPFKDSGTETITLIVACIKRMDDASLRRLAFLITSTHPRPSDIQGFNQPVETEEIFEGLQEIRDNPDIALHSLEKSKNPQLMSNICSLDCTMEWSDRSCWPFMIIFSIILIFDVLFVYPISLLLQMLTVA
jgi:hypothetical protein